MTRAWNLVGQTADVPLEELTALIAAEAGIEVATLDGAEPRAAGLVPAEVARRRNVVVLDCTDRRVTVATANPLGNGARREIAGLTGRDVVLRLAHPTAIAEAVLSIYGPQSDEEAARVAAGPAAETPHPDGPHVLVVDDEAGQRTLVRATLEGVGYRVTTAKDGPEAVERIRSGMSFDLVTLDYWMDRMNGLRVLQQIRANPTTAKVPVVVLTGADDRQIEMSLFEAGADDFVTKPIDGPLLILRIQAVLRRRRHA
jgi:CheY-like chemotaxis protein